MAKIHLKHRHNLAHDEARARVEKIANDLKDKLKTEYAWDGDSMRFRRSGASGSIDVGEEFLEFNIKLGMLFAPMKAKIEASIRKNIDGMMSDTEETKST